MAERVRGTFQNEVSACGSEAIVDGAAFFPTGRCDWARSHVCALGWRLCGDVFVSHVNQVNQVNQVGPTACCRKVHQEAKGVAESMSRLQKHTRPAYREPTRQEVGLWKSGSGAEIVDLASEWLATGKPPCGEHAKCRWATSRSDVPLME